MAKRIFKVIGIVLASVVGLIGAVVGVLAIMGKFKTPVVYPKQLVFAEPEMIIVDKGVYEDLGDVKLSSGEDGIYSFTLLGNSEQKQDVTKKDCLLTVTTGANLIQICDVNGDPAGVEKVNGKYKIKCNEKTYFRLKKIEDKKLTGLNYGKVCFKAEDERMMASTGNNGLTIWIDRVVESIGINENYITNVETFEENNKVGKRYTVGLEEGLAFDAVTSPSYALNPISKENYGGKIVEFYYFKPGEMTDWAFIDKNNLEVYPFLTYNEEDGMIYFRADSTEFAGKTFQFRVAVFATYADREKYLASISGVEDDISNLDRMSSMVWSRFNIAVKSTKVTAIGSETSNVDLSLFEQNNNLVMNAETEGFKNLNLYMISAGTRNYSRFYEADFDLRTINLIKNTDLTKDETIKTTWFKSYTEADFVANENLKLNLTTQEGNTFLDFFVYDSNSQQYRLATKEEFDYVATHIEGTTGRDRAFNISVKTMPNLSAGLQLVLGAMVVNNSGEYYFTSIDANIAESDLNYTYIDGKQEHTLTIDYTANPAPNCGSLSFEDIVAISAGSYRACVFVTPKNEEDIYDIEVLPNIIYTKVVNGETKEYVLVGYFENNKFVNRVKAKAGATNKGTQLYLLQLKNTYETNFAAYGLDAAEQYITSIFTKTSYNEETDETETIFNYVDGGNYTIGKNETNTILLNGDKGERFVGSSRMVVINVKYEITEDFSFDKFAVKGIETEEKLVNAVTENEVTKYELVAGFNYSVELTSGINEMLKNIYNARVDNIESFKDYLCVVTFDAAGNPIETDNLLTITSIASEETEETEEIKGNFKVIVSFNIEENADSAAEINARTYKIRFNYGNVQIDSNLIYAIADKPNNIQIAHTVTKIGTDDSETLEFEYHDISTENLKIEVLLGYAENNYTYTYKLVAGSASACFVGDKFELNTENKAITADPSFYVSPAYRDLRGDKNRLEYKLSKKNDADFTNVEVQNLEGLSVGTYILSVSTTGGLTRNLTIEVSAPTIEPTSTTGKGFTFNYTRDVNTNEINKTYNVTIIDQTKYLLNEGIVANGDTIPGVGYRYVDNETSTTANLPSLVNIKVADFYFNGSEKLKLVSTEFGYELRTDNESQEIVVSIVRENGDWQISREKYTNSSLSLTFDVTMDAFADAYQWTVTFGSSRQIDMNPAWTKIYADTNILFRETQTANNQFEKNALFQIRNNQGQDLTVKIYALNENEEYDLTTDLVATEQIVITNNITSLQAGTYLVEFFDGEELLASFSNIVALPNVIAAWNTSAGNLQSETSYNLTGANGLLTLQKYTANNSKNEAYGNTVTNQIYNTADLADIDNFSDFSIACDKNQDTSVADTSVTPLISLKQTGLGSNAQFKVEVGYFKDLNNASTCTISLQYKGNKIGESQAVVVKNKYSVKMTKELFMAHRDNLSSGVKLMEKTIDSSAEVSGATQTVAIETGYDLTIINGIYNVVKQNVGEKTTVIVTYSFALNSRSYTYTTEITLIPYVPTTVSGSDATKTQSQNTAFDIINYVFKFGSDGNYDDNGTIKDTNIKNIYVNNIIGAEEVDVNGVKYFDCFVPPKSTIIGFGYKAVSASASNTKFVVAIGKIIGTNKTVKISYTIEYVDGVVSTYEHTLNIENNLKVSEQYPFANSTTTDVYFVAVDGKEQDLETFGNRLGDEKYSHASQAGTYQFESGLKYEPVAIKQTIDLDGDAKMDIRRIKALNVNDNLVVENSIESIELVAFESISSARNYIFTAQGISFDNTKITFNDSNVFDSGTNALFLFKVNLTSGNYGFYLVRLHKQTGNFANIKFENVENNIDSGDTISIVPNWTGINAESLKSAYGITTNITNQEIGNLRYYLLSIKANGNSAIGAFDKTELNAGDQVELAQYCQLSVNSISNPNKFVQIKVAIVYTDNNKAFFVGNYITNITVTTGLDIYDEESNPTGFLHKAENFGCYSAEIDKIGSYSILTNDSTVGVNSLTVELTGATKEEFVMVGNVIRTNLKEGDVYVGKVLITFNYETIEVDNSTTSNLTFKVKYKLNNGATVTVDYGFKAVAVNSINNAILGNFDTSTGFNTNLNLSSMIGSYSGAISYFVDGGVSENVTNNEIDFSTYQTTETITKKVVLIFNNLFETNSNSPIIRSFTVTIYPAYHIDQGIGGGTETSPYQAQAVNNYNGAIGSKATIIKTENSSLGYTTYMMRNDNIGGLKIYVKNGTTLKFKAGTLNADTNLEENYANYVVIDSETGTLLTKDENFIVEQASEINFVHSARNKNIFLKINLLDNSGEEIKDKNNNEIFTINFYVTLPSTYTNFKANYTVTDSNHDNFVMGTTNNEILDYLFSNAYKTSSNPGNIYSSIRMSLITGSTSDGKDIVVSDFDAKAMGFLNKNNPNHLGLLLGDALHYEINRNSDDEETGDYNLIVNTVSDTNKTWLKLTNGVGLESKEYTINILTQTDKLLYEADSDDVQYLTNHSEWSVDANQYASVVINDSILSDGYDYSKNSTQNKIAKIYDENNNVFKIAVSGSASLEQVLDETGLIVDGSYVITLSGYKISIWRNDYREILFNITRSAGTRISEKLAVNFDIYTNTGKLCSFSLNVFNYNIEVGKTTSTYATDTFELKDLFKITNNSKINITSNFNYKLIYDGKTSYYTVDKTSSSREKVYITGVSNNLFEYNEANSTITTYQVPDQIQLHAFIQISNADGQIIDVVERIVTIKRNIQFKVDGNTAAADSVFNSTVELRDKFNKDTKKFNSINLLSDTGYKLTLNFVDSEKAGINIQIKPDIATVAVSEVEVNDFTGNIISNYVTLSDSYVLSFLRDFSGHITISLTYITNSGNFRQYWDIEVVGLQTFTYLSDNPTSSFTKNSAPYASGDSVDIVASSITKNPAISSTATTNSGVDYQYKIKLSHIVLNSSEYNDITMDSLLNTSTFSNALPVSGFNGTTSLGSVAINTTMPIVPQSSTDDRNVYYVVFKIQYNYAGSNLQPYFAIYQVRNVATITLAPNVSTVINVDEKSNIYDADNKQLRLFYFAENFGTTENGCKLIYVGNSKYSITYYSTETVENEKVTTTWAASKVTPTVKGNKLTFTNIAFESNGTTKTQSCEFDFDALKCAVGGVEYKHSSSQKYIAESGLQSMFKTDYVNILRYKDYVDSIEKITINSKEYAKGKLGYTNDGVVTLSLLGQTLFTNSAENAEMNIYLIGSQEAVNTFTLSLKGNQTISPKGSLTLSQIFQDGSYKTDYRIVGIALNNGSAASSWFNGTGIRLTSGGIQHKFKYNEQDYSVYKVTAKGASPNNLYELEAEFYYLQASSTTIYAVDYLSRGESNCFRVQYIEGKDSTIDLSKVLKEYKNAANGALKGSELTISGISYGSTTDYTLKVANKTLTIAESGEGSLISYKQKHKDETSLNVNVSAGYNGTNYAVTVRFDLPELTYIAEYKPTTIGDISSVVFALSTVESDIANCRNIVLYDSNNIAISLTNNNIVVAKSVLDASGAAYMKAKYKLTYTKTDSTTGAEVPVEIEFVVRWNCQLNNN